jgi:preprotein translocase subunit SecG
MFTFLAIVYTLVCFFLIAVVLLQPGKGGGLGSALGGGGSQTVFGGAGAGNFLTRLTAVCAALFMVLSATLAYMSSGSEKSLERAAQDVAAREAARGAAIDGEPASEPEPAEMSVPPSEDAADDGATPSAGDGADDDLGAAAPDEDEAAEDADEGAADEATLDPAGGQPAD